MAVTTTFQAKDNVFYIQIFGKGIPTDGRTATKEEKTLIRQWISEAGRNELSVDAKNEKQSGDGKIEVYLINYPVKKTPLTIRSVGKHVQLIDPVGVEHILEHEQLRVFLGELDG